jgi:hypothetical protein
LRQLRLKRSGTGVQEGAKYFEKLDFFYVKKHPACGGERMERAFRIVETRFLFELINIDKHE